MDRPKLKVEKRVLFGHKVKALRRDGVVPGNVFGRDVKSLAIQLPAKKFLSVFEEVGETGLIDLEVDSEVRPVIVSNVQYHPVSDLPLHVDLRQVNLKEKIQAPVPVEITGESPAEKSGTGILVQQITEVEVEALPTDLPEAIVVDITKLENVDDAILVRDLMVDKSKVSILTDEENIVVKIEPPAKEEEIAPPPAAVGEEGAPVEGGEAEGGETPAEGGEPQEAPKEEKKEES